jgi:hypothetical protein
MPGPAIFAHNGPSTTLRQRRLALWESEETMIQRLLGLLTGGIVTFLLLWLFDDGRIVSNEKSGWLLAIALGALANLMWPFIWGLFIARRVRHRRDEEMRSEVQRQVESQSVIPGDPETPA